jgi:protease-4
MMGERMLGWMAGLVVVLCVAGCGQRLTVGLTPADRSVRAQTVREAEGWRSPRVAIVDVSGLMVNAERGGLLRPGDNPVARLDEELRAAADDERVVAVVLRINSPGGGVAASQMMHERVVDFRQRTGKPVVSLMMDVAASGGYYVACAGEPMMAHPGTVTGSIGVVMQTLSVADGLSRIGVEPVALVSGPNKTAGSPLSRLTPEQRATLQAVVDEFYGQFLDVVRAARPGLTGEAFTTATDGRVVSGTHALRLGLVDRLGGLDDALAEARELAGVDSADVVIYRRPDEFAASPYASARPVMSRAAGPATIDQSRSLLRLDLGLGNTDDAGFYYLWHPPSQ